MLCGRRLAPKRSPPNGKTLHAFTKCCEHGLRGSSTVGRAILGLLQQAQAQASAFLAASPDSNTPRPSLLDISMVLSALVRLSRSFELEVGFLILREHVSKSMRTQCPHIACDVVPAAHAWTTVGATVRPLPQHEAADGANGDDPVADDAVGATPALRDHFSTEVRTFVATSSNLRVFQLSAARLLDASVAAPVSAVECHASPAGRRCWREVAGVLSALARVVGFMETDLAEAVRKTTASRAAVVRCEAGDAALVLWAVARLNHPLFVSPSSSHCGTALLMDDSTDVEVKERILGGAVGAHASAASEHDEEDPVALLVDRVLASLDSGDGLSVGDGVRIAWALAKLRSEDVVPATTVRGRVDRLVEWLARLLPKLRLPNSDSDGGDVGVGDGDGDGVSPSTSAQEVISWHQVGSTLRIVLFATSLPLHLFFSPLSFHPLPSCFSLPAPSHPLLVLSVHPTFSAIAPCFRWLSACCPPHAGLRRHYALIPLESTPIVLPPWACSCR